MLENYKDDYKDIIILADTFSQIRHPTIIKILLFRGILFHKYFIQQSLLKIHLGSPYLKVP